MKRNIIIILTLIATFLIIVVGSSFALFTKSEVQEGTNQINVYNCLDISINGENELNLINAYPIKDAEGIMQEPYTFVVTNNCDHFVGVDIGVEYQETSTINAGLIKATLNKHNEKIIPRLLNSYELVQATNSETGQPIENAKYIMAHEGLPAGDSQTFEYRMWINYSVEDLNSSDKLNVKIIAIGTVQNEESAPSNWFNSENGTLLSALRNNNTIRKTLTTPGKQITLTNEGILSSTEDDYGTSYYYRGSVENNYVLFAGKCWKIVRITGDGSIKISYWGSDTTCSTASWAFSTNYFNNVSGNISTDYMYGDASGTTYEEVHANLHDSIILKRLKSWYNNTFNENQKNMLADVIWCNDKSLVSGSGVGNESTTYGPTSRVSKQKPSLICPDAGLDGKLSKFTADDSINGNAKLRGVDGEGTELYKIGLLTTDEYSFIGIITWPNTNKKAFIFANNGWYWTLSPYKTNEMYYYHYDSRLYFVPAYDSPGGRVAPVVALTKETKITSGNGSKTEPYIINEN